MVKIGWFRSAVLAKPSDTDYSSMSLTELQLLLGLHEDIVQVMKTKIKS
jgi:hypothetical protein